MTVLPRVSNIYYPLELLAYVVGKKQAIISVQLQSGPNNIPTCPIGPMLEDS
jgi:hypothetical protein